MGGHIEEELHQKDYRENYIEHIRDAQVFLVYLYLKLNHRADEVCEDRQSNCCLKDFVVMDCTQLFFGSSLSRPFACTAFGHFPVIPFGILHARNRELTAFIERAKRIKKLINLYIV